MMKRTLFPNQTLSTKRARLQAEHSDPPPPSSRRRFRRALCTLLIFSLLFASFPASSLAADAAPLLPQDPFAALDLSPDIKAPSITAPSLEKETDANIYTDASGQKTAEFFSAPVRFEDENGKLIDYDPSLTKSTRVGYDFENAAGDMKLYLPENIDSNTPVLLENGDYAIKLSPVTDTDFATQNLAELTHVSEVVNKADGLGTGMKIAAPDSGLISDDSESAVSLDVASSAYRTRPADPIAVKEAYTDCYDNEKQVPLKARYALGSGASVEYTSSDLGVKEEIILTSAPEVNTFVYNLNLEGTTPQLTADGRSVLLFDKADPSLLVATIPEGRMWDSSTDGAQSSELYYTLAQKEDVPDSYLLTLVADKSYLQSPDRVWPVTIDPTLSWQGSFASKPDGSGFTTTFIRSGAAYADSVGSAAVMPVGKGREGTSRSYMKGDNFNATIKGKSVTAATLTLRQVNNSAYNKNLNVGIYRVLVAGTGQTNNPTIMCWNNRPDYAGTALVSKATGTTSYDHSFDVKAFAQGVANSTFAGYGLMIRQTDETQDLYTQFYGCTEATAAYRPKITVTYAEPPTKATSITASPSNYWKKGAALPKITWAGISSSNLDRIEFRVYKGTTDSAGVHTVGTNIIKDFGTSPYIPTTAATTGYALPVTDYAQGCYGIYIRGHDSTGAVGPATGFWLHIDGTAPTLTMPATPISPATSTTVYSNKLPTISWSGVADSPACNGGSLTVEAYVKRPDGTASAVRNVKTASGSFSLGPGSYTFLAGDFISGASGAHTLVLRAKDRVGNVSAEKSYAYYYDATAPKMNTPTISPAAAASGWNKARDISLDWSGLIDTPSYSGNSVKLQIAVNKAGATQGTFSDLTPLAVAASGTTPLSSSLFPDSGKYEIRIRPVDKVGNIGATTLINYWRDTVAPVLDLKVTEAATGNVIFTTSAQLPTGLLELKDTLNIGMLITEAHSGLEGGTLTLTNLGDQSSSVIAPNVTVSSTVPLVTNLYENGNYKLTFSGKDKAGNVAKDAVSPFQIKNPLAAPVLLTVDSATKNTNAFDVSWAFFGGQSKRAGYQVALESDEGLGPWSETIEDTENAGSITVFTPLGPDGLAREGSYKIWMRAISLEGEPGVEAPVEVTVRLTGPLAQLSAMDAGILKGTVQSPYLLDYSVFVKQSGQPDSAYSLISKGDANRQNETLAYYDLATLRPAQRSYTFKLEATDLAGNITTSTMEVFSAISTSELSLISGAELDLPLGGSIRSAHNTISLSDPNAFGASPYSWYVNGAAAGQTPDVSQAPTLPADFTDDAIFQEGGYYTVFGRADSEVTPLESASAKQGTGTLYEADFSDEGSFEYQGGHFEDGAFVTEDIPMADLTCPEVVSALPFRSLSISGTEMIPQGSKIEYYVSVDGGAWEKLSDKRWSAAGHEKAYGTRFRLEVLLRGPMGSSEQIGLSELKVDADFIRPDVISIDFLKAAAPEALIARDKLDYKTYLGWEAAPAEDILPTIAYEVLYSNNVNAPAKTWKSLAEGLTEHYFASPNTDYSATLYYRVRAVRTEQKAGQTAKYSGEFSNACASTVADSYELAKRLGTQEYWDYENVTTPVGSAQIEKSWGNFVFTQTDKQIEADSLLQDGVTRTYNSQSSLVFPFGMGTDFSYNVELLKQVEGNSYVLKDDTGTLRTFFYDERNETYFTQDSKRVRLQVFDAPKPVRVLTKKGAGSEENTYDKLLVKFVVTFDKKCEYWFNQGGQLVYITEKAQQLDGQITEGKNSYEADDAQANLVLSYDAKRGWLTEVISKGLRRMHFAHNSAGLISAVWLPDETVVGYTYQDKYLADVRLYATHVSEQAFTSGTMPQATDSDIAYSYAYSKPVPSIERYYLTSVSGVENDSTQIRPQTRISYSPSGQLDTLMQATKVIDAHGNRTDIAYGDMTDPTTLSSYTPAELTLPSRATKTTYGAAGLMKDTWQGTPDEVANLSARHVSHLYQDYLLMSTTTDSEHHSIDGSGEIKSHLIRKTTSAQYNALDLPTTITEDDGSITQEQYGQTGGINEEEVTDEKTFDGDGNVIADEHCEFDSAGQETLEEDRIEGEVTTSQYYPNGNLKSEKISLQRFEGGVAQGAPVPQTETSYVYDDDDNVIEEINTSFGSPDVITKTTSAYDGLGRLLTTTTGTLSEQSLTNWTKTTNTYDFMGRLIQTATQEEGSDTKIATTAYNKDGTVASTIDETGTVTSYTYDELGRTLTTTVTPPNQAAQVSMTAYGYENISLNAPEGTRAIAAAVTSSTDPAGTVTKSYTDSLDQVVRTQVAGVDTDTTYTKDGKTFATIVLPVSHLRAEAKVSLSLYDENGNTIATVKQPDYENGHYVIGEHAITSQSAFDAEGKVQAKTDALGRSTSYSYDAKGVLASVTLPVATFIADASDPTPQSKETETVAAATTFESDVIDPATGMTVDTVRDALGRLSTIRKDANDKILAVTDYGQPSASANTGISTTYQYNDKDQQVKLTFANGDYKTFAYDTRDNLTETKWYRAGGALELSSENTYDSFNRVISTTDFSHQGTSATVIYYQRNSYDKAGKLTSSFEGHTLPADPEDIPDSDKTCFTYDKLDRLTQLTYPQDSSETTNTPVALKHSYDSEGRISKITAVLKTGSATRQATLRAYVYDDWNRAAEVRDFAGFTQGSATYISKRYSYDVFDRVTALTYALSTDPGTAVESFTYSYNKNSQIASERHTASYPDADPIDELRTYTYDELGLLVATDATDNIEDVTTSHTYGYDRVGNRRMEATGGRECYSVYNGLNQLTGKETESATVSFSYDANGNLSTETSGNATTTFSYDIEGRLAFVKKGALIINSNTYRSDGQRISKSEGSATINYVYQNGSVLYTTDSAGEKSSFNLYSPAGALIASKRYQGTQANEYLTYIKDIRGSTASILDSSAKSLTSYTYGDFGETIRSGDSEVFNEIAYTGGIYDESTGLYYLNARYYSPDNAGFLTADDTAQYGNLEDPTSLNKYLYCQGDPINYTDPSGNVAWWVAAAIGGAAFDTAWYIGRSLIKKEKITWKGAAKAAVIGAVTGVTFGAAGKGIKALKIAPKVVKAAPKLTKAAKKLTPAARRYVRKIAKPASKAGQKSARSSKKATRKISTKINKAAKKANPSGGETCFIAGTLIATEEGDEPIEDVKEGDLVYSEDPETGEIAFKRVVRTFIHQTEDLVHINVDGQVITTTQEHPFWNPRCGWTDAGDLRAGDELLLRSGEVVVIEAVWYEVLGAPVTVYNFEVEDFHTYFVSSSAVFVHNACGDVLPKKAKSFTGKTAFDNASKHLQKYHGVDPKVASRRLHKIKEQQGLAPNYDVIIDKTGNVYNKSRRWLGTLTE